MRSERGERSDEIDDSWYHAEEDLLNMRPIQATATWTKSILPRTDVDCDTVASGMLIIARVRSPPGTLEIFLDWGSVSPAFDSTSPTTCSWDPRSLMQLRRTLPTAWRESRRRPVLLLEPCVVSESERLFVSVLPLNSAAHRASHAHRMGDAFLMGSRSTGRSSPVPAGPTAPRIT